MRVDLIWDVWDDGERREREERKAVEGGKENLSG